jgi:subtilisin-like proprotein convertase family protein
MTIFTSGSKALGVLRSMAVVLALSLPGVAFAAAPSTLAVHGGLFSVGGGPVADGTYAVTFSLYAASSGGVAVFAEGPVNVTVKSGFYHFTLGVKTPINPAVFANLTTPFVGVKVGADPEFPRQSLSSVPFAMRSVVTETLDCTGCVKSTSIDPAVLAPYAKSADLSKSATTGAYGDLAGTPDLAPYAKSAELTKFASSGAYADLAGTPDLTIYAKAAALAALATSGAYADLTGVPDLTSYALAADLAAVATSGSYADLGDLPTLVATDAACDPGFLAEGINEDGTLACVEAATPSVTADMLPNDGLVVVSNGVLTNLVTDTLAGKTAIAIPDNSPVGVTDSVTVGALGTIQSMTVSVDLTNSNIGKLVVYLYDPNGDEYILHNKSGSGTVLKTTYPTPTAVATGDLAAWKGQSPAGKWYLKVLDSTVTGGNSDGAINSWSVAFTLVSAKTVNVKSNIAVTGNVTVAGQVSAAQFIGGLTPSTYRWGVWSTYSPNGGWMFGNQADLFGGVNPSTWSDGNANASDISADKAVQAALFSRKGSALNNARVYSEWFKFGQSRGCSSCQSRFAGTLFRVKNTTSAAITWPVRFAYTAFPGWSERASVAVNGQNVWYTDSDCATGCLKDVGIAIPANRTSTVIFVSATGNPSSGSRALIHGFTNNSLALPAGLQYVDDLDTATGGYDQ